MGRGAPSLAGGFAAGVVPNRLVDVESLTGVRVGITRRRRLCVLAVLRISVVSRQSSPVHCVTLPQ